MGVVKGSLSLRCRITLVDETCERHLRCIEPTFLLIARGIYSLSYVAFDVLGW